MSVTGRIESIFQRAYARPAEASEIERWQQAVEELAELHGVQQGDVLTSEIVWQEVAHAIFNTKEFIYVR